jgi:hypothetical protein
VKSIEAAAGAGAWEGITEATEPGALAAPGLMLWLTYTPAPMSSLPARMQQQQTQEKRISCLKRQQEKELAKSGLSRKELAKLGKKCAPVCMMVLVAGNLPRRSPATQLDAAPAYRLDGKL